MSEDEVLRNMEDPGGLPPVVGIGKIAPPEESEGVLLKRRKPMALHCPAIKFAQVPTADLANSAGKQEGGFCGVGNCQRLPSSPLVSGEESLMNGRVCGLQGLF